MLLILEKELKRIFRFPIEVISLGFRLFDRTSLETSAQDRLVLRGGSNNREQYLQRL